MESISEEMRSSSSLQLLWVVFGVLFASCDAFASNEGMCFSVCCSLLLGS